MDRVTYDIPLPDAGLLDEVYQHLQWYQSLNFIESIHLDELRKIRRKLAAAQFLLAPEYGRVRYLKESSRFLSRRKAARAFGAYKKTGVTNEEAGRRAQIDVEEDETARAVYSGAYDTLSTLLDSIDSTIFSLGDDIRKLEKEMSYDRYLNDLPRAGGQKNHDK